MWVYTYVYGELTIGMYKCINIGTGTYLRRFVECVCGRLYFCGNNYSSLSIKGDCQIKVGPRLKRASILLSHLLGSLGSIQSGNIFMSSLWVAENLEAGNVHSCIYANKDRDRLRLGQTRPERVGCTV